jgi:hypothetical protein
MTVDRELPATRDALALPWLFLTVALLGSIRVGPDGYVTFAGPTLFSLVLAVTLAGLLLRAGLLSPAVLVGPHRSALANLNGLSVLIALLFASAQVFTMLTPDGGLLELLFDAFFIAMLWTTAAARPDAPRLVRSLFVVFGWALVLRFVILNGLAAPDGSLARRLFAIALEGLTLGALGLTYHQPATGYVAFVMLALFLVALLLMPSSAWTWSLIRSPSRDALSASSPSRFPEAETEGRSLPVPPDDDSTPRALR